MPQSLPGRNAAIQTILIYLPHRVGSRRGLFPTFGEAWLAGLFNLLVGPVSCFIGWFRSFCVPLGSVDIHASQIRMEAAATNAS